MSAAHGAGLRRVFRPGARSGWGKELADLLQQLQEELGLCGSSGLPRGERPAVSNHIDMLLSVRRGPIAGLLRSGLHAPLLRRSLPKC